MRILAASLFLVLAGCGGGGDGDAADAADVTEAATTTTPVVTWHASGRIHEQGAVLTGTGVRTGEWTRHFDAEGSPVQWRGTYADGAVDGARPWTEWNADGSVRVDAADR